ncbi:hypothetical protein AOLI_G00142050 [Acnodon oligacanthus]
MPQERESEKRFCSGKRRTLTFLISRFEFQLFREGFETVRYRTCAVAGDRTVAISSDRPHGFKPSWGQPWR